jgi:hypothetical protein
MQPDPDDRPDLVFSDEVSGDDTDATIFGDSSQVEASE